MAEAVSKSFHLQVISVNGTFYDDDAVELILPCEDGEMAILFGHEEMILAIYKSAAEHRPVKLPLEECSTMDFIGRFGEGKIR